MVLIHLKKIILILSLLLFTFSVCASEKSVDQIIESKFKNYEDLLKTDEISEENQILLYKKLNFILIRTKATKIVVNKDEVLFMNIINKSDDFDLDDYDFDELSEKYIALLNQIKKQQFELNYYATARFITWNYRLQLTDQSGFEKPIYSKEKGLCVGAGAIYENAYWGMATDFCYAYMTATVGEDSTTIKYNQSSVPVDALVSTSSIFWKPKEEVSFGAGPLLVYHSADYAPPTGGSIQDTKNFSYGYHILASWRKSSFKIDISIGDVKDYKSSIWQIGLQYIF
mgnify:CR=1 FL=1